MGERKSVVFFDFTWGERTLQENSPKIRIKKQKGEDAKGEVLKQWYISWTTICIGIRIETRKQRTEIGFSPKLVVLN